MKLATSHPVQRSAGDQGKTTFRLKSDQGQITIRLKVASSHTLQMSAWDQQSKTTFRLTSDKN